MKHSGTSDPTLDPVWQAEQMDRLLGFEILTRTLHASYQPIEPELLADKIGATKGYSFNLLKSISRRLNEPK
jgi:hypothetical protein